MTDSRSSSAIADSRATTHELGFGTKGPQVGGPCQMRAERAADQSHRR
jgi:hypothetical protein